MKMIVPSESTSANLHCSSSGIKRLLLILEYTSGCILKSRSFCFLTLGSLPGFSTRSQQQLCGQIWRCLRSQQLWPPCLLGIIMHFSRVTLFQRCLKKALSLQILGPGRAVCKQEGRCFIQEVSDKWGKCDYDSIGRAWILKPASNATPCRALIGSSNRRSRFFFPSRAM